jgi:hypothetical protein
MHDMNNILQILDISTVSVDTRLFNTTAVNRLKDPYWVEFVLPFFQELDVEIKILSLDKINFEKKWIINLDINMWNWDLHTEDILESLDVKIINELKYGNAYIILNHQCESFTVPFFKLFYRKKLSIPYNKIIYMVAAADVAREYKNFTEENNIDKDKHISVLYAHHVYKRFKHDVDLSAFEYSSSKKVKKYLSLNRTWREHRVMLVSLLAKKNLIKDGFVSLGIMHDEKEKAQPVLCSDEIIDGYLKIKNNLPLQVDNVDLTTNQFQMNSLPILFYQQSCFSLVSSTMALHTQEPSVGFTEKEIKPILARHPFIIWNRPGVLKHLHNMGFLTFDPWFDESYDNEVDDIKRLEKIVNEVDRLCSYSFDDWEKILQEMKPVLDHNYNRMIKYTSDHCYFNSDLKKLLYYVS